MRNENREKQSAGPCRHATIRWTIGCALLGLTLTGATACGVMDLGDEATRESATDDETMITFMGKVFWSNGVDGAQVFRPTTNVTMPQQVWLQGDLSGVKANLIYQFEIAREAVGEREISVPDGEGSYPKIMIPIHKLMRSKLVLVTTGKLNSSASQIVSVKNKTYQLEATSQKTVEAIAALKQTVEGAKGKWKKIRFSFTLAQGEDGKVEVLSWQTFQPYRCQMTQVDYSTTTSGYNELKSRFGSCVDPEEDAALNPTAINLSGVKWLTPSDAVLSPTTAPVEGAPDPAVVAEPSLRRLLKANRGMSEKELRFLSYDPSSSTGRPVFLVMSELDGTNLEAWEYFVAAAEPSHIALGKCKYNWGSNWTTSEDNFYACDLKQGNERYGTFTFKYLHQPTFEITVQRTNEAKTELHFRCQTNDPMALDAGTDKPLQ